MRSEDNCITRLVDAEYAVELNCIVCPMRNEVNCITRLVDAESALVLKPRYLLAPLLRTKGELD